MMAIGHNYVAKWMKTPLKIFIESLKQYSEWINARSSDFNMKISYRIERLKNIKWLVQIYLGLNKENEWMLRTYLVSFNLATYKPRV